MGQETPSASTLRPAHPGQREKRTSSRHASVLAAGLVAGRRQHLTSPPWQAVARAALVKRMADIGSVCQQHWMTGGMKGISLWGTVCAIPLLPWRGGCWRG